MTTVRGIHEVERDPAQGEALKQEGMARVLAARENARWAHDVGWPSVILLASLSAKQGTTFTAEDLRGHTGDPPGHPNAMGALVSSAKQVGLIEPVELTYAERPSSHRGKQFRYRGTEIARMTCKKLYDEGMYEREKTR